MSDRDGRVGSGTDQPGAWRKELPSRTATMATAVAAETKTRRTNQGNLTTHVHREEAARVFPNAPCNNPAYVRWRRVVAAITPVPSRLRSIRPKLAKELFTKTCQPLTDADARAAVGNVSGSHKTGRFTRDLLDFAPAPGSPCRPAALARAFSGRLDGSGARTVELAGAANRPHPGGPTHWQRTLRTRVGPRADRATERQCHAMALARWLSTTAGRLRAHCRPRPDGRRGRCRIPARPGARSP
jgi:hypothetical protein